MNLRKLYIRYIKIVLSIYMNCCVQNPEQQNAWATGSENHLDTTVATGHNNSEDGKRDLSPLFTLQHSVSIVTATLVLVEVNDIPVTCSMAAHCGY